MQLPLLHTVTDYFIAFAAAFAVIMLRYFLIAGLFQILFHREKWKVRKVTERSYSPRQFRKEVTWSLITGSIFAAVAVLTLWLYQKGYTLVYLQPDEKGWLWLPTGLLLAMFLHETYYYLLHRWMHNPKVFRVLHQVHHESNITSPWTAFSFHPLEGLLQAIVLPITLMIIPMHPYVLLLQLTIMTFSSVINHLNIEIYPQSFNKHFIGRWLIGATHHSLHHKQFKYNYGLYFTFWDKWKGTESPNYNDLFETKTSRSVKEHSPSQEKA
jgi:Delta7-sterol 5-desaturase